MTALTDLPAELVSTFAAMLEKTDLMSMRAANKVLANKSLDVFRALFNKKTIMIARPSLESLIAISKDDRLASSLRTLVISSCAFNVAGLKAGVTLHTAETVADTLTHQDAKREPDMDHGEGFSHRQFTAFAALLKDQHQLHKSGEDVELLAEALRKLQDLRVISFENPISSISPFRSSQPQHGILGLGKISAAVGAHNIHAIMVSYCGVWTFEDQLPTVLRAIAASKASIQRLTLRAISNSWSRMEDLLTMPQGLHVGTNQILPVKAFLDDFTASGGSFPLVKSIALQYRSGEVTDAHRFRSRDPENPNIVDVELEQMIHLFPKLTTLSLRAAFCGTDVLPRFSDNFVPPKLSTLVLRELTTSVDDLVRALMFFKDTLESLTLNAIYLINGSWHDLADPVSRLSKLERLGLKRVENEDGTWFVYSPNAPTKSSMIPYDQFDHHATATTAAPAQYMTALPIQMQGLPSVMPGTVIGTGPGGAPIVFGGLIPGHGVQPLTTPQPPPAAPNSQPQPSGANGTLDQAASATAVSPAKVAEKPPFNTVVLNAPGIAEKLFHLPF